MAQQFGELGDPFGRGIYDEARELANFETQSLTRPQRMQVSKDIEQLINQAEKLRRWTLGISPIPQATSALGKDVSEMLVNMNIWSYLGGAGISATADIGLAIAQYRLKPFFRDAWHYATNDAFRHLLRKRRCTTPRLP